MSKRLVFVVIIAVLVITSFTYFADMALASKFVLALKSVNPIDSIFTDVNTVAIFQASETDQIQSSKAVSSTVHLPIIVSNERVTSEEQSSPTWPLTLEQILTSDYQILSACDLDAGQDKNAITRINLIFKKRISIDDLDWLIEKYKLVGTTLIYEHNDHRSFHRINTGQSIRDAAASFDQYLNNFFEEMILVQKDMSNVNKDLDNSANDASRAQLLKNLEEQLVSLQNEGLLISGIEAFAPKSSIELLTSTEDVLQRGCNTSIALHVSASSTQQEVPDISTWVPQQGEIFGQDGIYLASQFKWTDSSGFTQENPWYEHDIFISESKPRFVECVNTFTWAVTFIGLPIPALSQTECSPSSMSSNLPDWYPDTRFMDKVETYSIGTESANLIQEGKWYYTHFSIEVEDPTIPFVGVGVGSQYGRLPQLPGDFIAEPDFCERLTPILGHGAACIFAAENNRILSLTDNAPSYSNRWSRGQSFRRYWRNGMEDFPQPTTSTPTPEATSTTEPDSFTPTPPSTSNVQLVGINSPATVSPSQSFVPEITVHLNNGQQLLESRSDMLRHFSGTNYSSFPHIGVVGTINSGATYTFRFYNDNPFVAPNSNGTYESIWRIWADDQWVGPEIVIRFTVGSSDPDPSQPSWLLSHSESTVVQYSQYKLSATISDIAKRAFRLCINHTQCAEISGGNTYAELNWDALGASGQQTISYELDPPGSDSWDDAHRYEHTFNIGTPPNGLANCDGGDGAYLRSGSECIRLTQDFPALDHIGWSDRDMTVQVIGPLDAWVYIGGDFTGPARVVRTGTTQHVGNNSSSIRFIQGGQPAPLPTTVFACDTNTYALYHLGENGSTTIDSCNGRNGTNHVPNMVAGKLGDAQHFNGGGGRKIHLGTHTLVCPLTIDLWFRRAENHNGAIVSQLGGNGNAGQNKWLLAFVGDRVKAEYWSNGGSQDTYSNIQIHDQNWHYLMLTHACDRTTNLYLDNRLEGTFQTAGTIYGGATTIEIGAAESQNGFYGDIDEVRISTILRSPDDLGPFDVPSTPTPLPTATFTPTPIATPTTAATPTPSSSNSVLLESFEDGKGDWANEGAVVCILQRQDHATEGSNNALVCIAVGDGVMRHDVNANWSEYGGLSLDIFNTDPNQEMSLILVTGSGYQEFETSRQSVPANGMNRLTFDFSGLGADLADVKKYKLRFFNGHSAEVQPRLDNIRLLQGSSGAPTATPIQSPSSSEVIIEDFQNGLGGWFTGGAAVCLVEEPIPGAADQTNKAAALCYNQPNGYAQFSQDADWSQITAVKVNLANMTAPTNATLFIGTGDFNWHESPGQLISTGTGTYTFPIGSWVSELNNVRYYGFKFFTSEGTEQKVYLDDIRLVE